MMHSGSMWALRQEPGRAGRRAALVLLAGSTILRWGSVIVVVEAARIPTAPPTDTTVTIDFFNGGYTGAIPTELGRLTKATFVSLSGNKLTGTIPTQLGQLDQTSFYFDLSENLLSSAIPTQLGLLDQISSNFDLTSNSLSLAIPTQLGRLDQMTDGFRLRSNLLSSTIPTQLGLLDQMNIDFWLSWNSLLSTIPTQLGKMSSAFELQSNLLSSTIPTQLGALNQMSSAFEFDLYSNSLCGYLPTELASLPVEFGRQHNTKDGNSIGSPCPPSSIIDDHHDGLYVYQTWNMVMIAAMWVVVGGAFIVVVLSVLIGYTARAKRFAANGDNTESTSSGTFLAPLLDNGGTYLNDRECSLQLQSMPGQPLNLTHAWRSSNVQLVVLDSELRVMLWSKGMVKVMAGFRPAMGASIEGLPFLSVGKQQTVINGLESIMGERGAESEAALHPLLALQAAVATAPNVTLHMVTTLSNGVRKEVLLSMTAVKMKPLEATMAIPLAEVRCFDYEPCHMLIMGKQSFDPALMSLAYDSRDAPSLTVSDLTSDSGSAGNLGSAEDTRHMAGAGGGQWHEESSSSKSGSSSSSSKSGSSSSSSSNSNGPGDDGGRVLS